MYTQLFETFCTLQVGQLTFTDIDYADDVALLVDKEESLLTALTAMDEEASKFGLRVAWTKTKLQNLGSGSTPSPIIVAVSYTHLTLPTNREV